MIKGLEYMKFQKNKRVIKNIEQLIRLAHTEMSLWYGFCTACKLIIGGLITYNRASKHWEGRREEIKNKHVLCYIL